MLGSTVLEVAIGLILCFASVALVTSSLNEALASALKWRAKTLLTGVKQMLNDDQLNGMVLSLYQHGLINPRSDGTADASTLKAGPLPSYIDPRLFAKSLTQVLNLTDPTLWTNAVAAIPNAQIKNMVQGMCDRSKGNIDALESELSNWFDSSMDRVSGLYKRRTQVACFVIALLLVIFLNVDAVALFGSLWKHPGAITMINGKLNTDDALKTLNALPIGWSEACFTWGADWKSCALIWASRVVGWLITASAALFGAPFWFDMLDNIARLRGTGEPPKP